MGIGILKDNKILFTQGYGIADQSDQSAATPDTIYAMASCSKSVVGVATARLMELHPEFDLDADISAYLGWVDGIENPDFLDDVITMRQLLLHKSSIAANAPFDYDTYPKPDPDTPLDEFLQAMLLDTDDHWLPHAPGAKPVYSNLGAALAGLVIEKVSGKPFNEFCNDEIFTPLKMSDTRWFFNEFSAAQQARIARPHDDQLKPYEHYAFNDYPSGLLRTSPKDFTRLLGMLANDGEYDGVRVLKPESVALFQSVPMFIEESERDGGTYFTHDGGESGVNTSFGYREDGTGFVYMINSDVDDEDLDALQVEIEGLIKTFDE